MTSVYVLIDPRTDEVRYVGKTSKPLRVRLAGHMHDRGKYHRAYWVQQLVRQGYEPRIELVQEVHDDHWREAERYWIAYFRTIGCDLTNATAGGEGGAKEYRHSDDTRAKMRHPRVYDTSGFSGHHHKAAARERIRAAKLEWWKHRHSALALDDSSAIP